MSWGLNEKKPGPLGRIFEGSFDHRDILGLLEPSVAAFFHKSQSVNRALRMLDDLAALKSMTSCA
jgi:hypothetical protein